MIERAVARRHEQRAAAETRSRRVEPLRELELLLLRERGADVVLERYERRRVDAEPARFDCEIRRRPYVRIEHETRGCDQRRSDLAAQRCDPRIASTDLCGAIE